MRLFTTVLAVIALSSVAGCATQTAASRGSDTAVRAEVRRISNARPYRGEDILDAAETTTQHSQRATSF